MQMDWPTVWYNAGITDDVAPIRLFIRSSIFLSLVNKISRLLELHNMRQQSIPIPEKIHHFLAENRSLRYGGPLHTRLQTAAVRGFKKLFLLYNLHGDSVFYWPNKSLHLTIVKLPQ